MLSKDSMKGMDLLAVSTDVLYALEKMEKPKKGFSEEIRRGFNLLDLLTSAATAQINKGHQRDLFMLRVIESLEKATGLPPSKLVESLEKRKTELKEGCATSETVDLLEKISKAVMDMTSRSVETLSTSLR